MKKKQVEDFKNDVKFERELKQKKAEMERLEKLNDLKALKQKQIEYDLMLESQKRSNLDAKH